jgi:exodeoxyribonuclease V alpha subunit
MTRGRHDNLAHLVAETPEQARVIWEQTFSRDRADLSVSHARLRAIDDIDRYGPIAPAKVRARADVKRRAEQQGQAESRRRFEPWRSDIPEPARPPISGPGIGF